MSEISQQNRGKINGDLCQKKRVLVAVKASKEVPRAALVWALTHIVQPGDRITLLLVVSPWNSARKLWSFSGLSGDCKSGCKKSKTFFTTNFKYDLTDSCSHMIFQLRRIYDLSTTKIKIKIISGSPCGAVAAESIRVQASWVVLDKQLKSEEKKCMEELRCNIVIMNHTQPQILRLKLLQSPERKLTNTEVGTISMSRSPFFLSEVELDSKVAVRIKKENGSPSVSSSESGLRFYPWMDLPHNTDERLIKTEEFPLKLNKEDHYIQEDLMNEFCKLGIEAGTYTVSHTLDIKFNRHVREAIETLRRNSSLGHPPLCSICKHKTSAFGKPPISFSYAELTVATRGFSQDNFLAEGGFGCVHRGVLSDGQLVAIKQHKMASSQGDNEFCSEVEILSCARHRNVVMLIGFCMENQRRLLVYEYVCNGSLNFHLYGSNQRTLEWAARRKIAVRAARGLRYLHEECRVGCIIHRDVRPNNILITHDFEALVGDFGLARWKPDGDLHVETQVIGSFGYLAPEYTQNTQITEKADVYSFGVVLLELLTGRRAMDIKRPKGLHRLTEWIRPFLKECAVEDLMDQRLRNHYNEKEAIFMLRAASLCISRNPCARPRMSQVLRILEGDCFMEEIA